MNLSHLTLRRLARDLETLSGARIQDASLAQPNELILDIARPGTSPVTRVLVSGSRAQSRICITQRDFPARPDRPPWVERYLLKAVVRSIGLQPDDRVITLDLDKQDRVGSRYPSRLIIEMMGRDSNAVLIDADGKIQGLLRNQTSEHRRLHPGAVFSPARPQDRRLPVDISSEDFKASLASLKTPRDALMTLCAGMDRFLAEELIHRAAEADADLLTTTRSFYRDPPFGEVPGCVLKAPGVSVAAVAFGPRHLDPNLFVEADTISEAIERTFADNLKGLEKQGGKKALRKVLIRAIRTANTKRDRISEDLDRARRADELEQKGSLILSNPQSIESGSASVELEDLFSEQKSLVQIDLNPKLTASENGQAYLKKAAKARKSEPVLGRRLGQAGERITELEKLLEEFDGLPDSDDGERFRQTLEQKGLIRPQRKKQKQDRKGPSGLHPRRYRTSDGWEVWVGRTDAENDRITRSAPRNAIWFHAHGCPGSHVVLRPRDQRDPSPEALHDAACLAAYWSKARGSKTAPVNYTEARYVQKPKGAPPGLVTIRHEKTLFVPPREIDKWDASE